jgi:endonuclease VIII
MPEGDTLFRTAVVLRRVLLGRTVREARAQPGPLLRRVPDLSVLARLPVSAVEARGKHLLIAFGEGRHRLTLRTHLRMTGSWHRYRVGKRWRLPERRATVILQTDAAVVVCFDCPTVELLTDAGVARSMALRTLGPDLLAPDFDLSLGLANFSRHRSTAVGEALLDQRLVAGIGNVVRNETLFMEHTNPWLRLDELDDATLARLLITAQRVLRANVTGGARTTTGNPRRGASLWVYDRGGRPCRRCGTLISLGRQGDLARLTFWCPSCQPQWAGSPSAAGARPRGVGRASRAASHRRSGSRCRDGG